MKNAPDFFTRNDPDQRPHEIAVEWLVSQDLQPGDEILQDDITHALGMIDPDELQGRELLKRWELARFPELALLIELFEERTGLILLTTHRGSYRVLEREDVSQALLGIMMRRIRRAIEICTGKLSRASKDGVSPIELQNRSKLSEFANNVKHFVSREKRATLNDGPAL